MLEPALTRMLKMPESEADGACLCDGASSLGPRPLGPLASHENPTDWVEACHRLAPGHTPSTYICPVQTRRRRTEEDPVRWSGRSS
jgi:hypothetical protein